MKFLLIGDFHGKIPVKLKNKIKREKFDYVLCTGDLYYFDKFRKLLFKYWKETNGMSNKLLKIIGKKEYNKLKKEYNLSINNVLTFLNSLNKPTYIVYGNTDTTLKAPWANKKNLKGKPLEEIIKKYKNLHFIDLVSKKIKKYNLFSYGCKLSDRFGKKFMNKLKNKIKINKNTILLSHEPPYNTKLDKIRRKGGPSYNKHIGDRLLKEIIKKKQPYLVVCGHIHESFGKIKIGKTLIINIGAACEGRAAILELNGKPKIRFIK